MHDEVDRIEDFRKPKAVRGDDHVLDCREQQVTTLDPCTQLVVLQQFERYFRPNRVRDEMDFNAFRNMLADEVGFVSYLTLQIVQVFVTFQRWN